MASSEDHSEKSNGAIEKVTEVPSLLPHLQSIDRILELPVCNSFYNFAWTQGQGAYGKIKG